MRGLLARFTSSGSITRAARLGAVLLIALIGVSSRQVYGQQTCPCTIWGPSVTPGPAAVDPNAVELGLQFRADTNGFITGVRFFKYAENSGTHVGNLWTSAGVLLGTANFSNEGASGWQVATFASPIAVTANTTYVASYHTSSGFYAASQNGLSAAVDNAPLHALADGAAGGNGLYRYGATSAFPNQSYLASNYWVDVVFTSNVAVDTTPPTVTNTSPLAGSTGVSTGANLTVTFSEPVTASTVSATTVQLKDAANTLVPGTVTYNAATQTATLDPTATLAATATYTLSIAGGASGVKDLAGNALASTYTASFTTAAGVGCPCSVWTMSTTPGGMAADGAALELGMKFRSDVDGLVSGLRFYKYAQNSGTHVGNLWTSAGALLGTVTFTGETASGWQQQNFAAPIAISANTTYVISYHTNTGFYAASSSFFTSAVDNTPLHAPADLAAPGNGVYGYGATSAFPNQTYQSTNYWVDVVFAVAGADTTAPTASMTAPSDGATVSGAAVTVSASASDNVGVAGVQFKLDGANLGPEDTVSPYTMTWSTSTVANGSHTLTATARDAAGNTTTATVVTVTVNNADATPPTVSMTAPAQGATVAGTTVALSATAADNIGIVGVQFKLDGVSLGAEDTVSPYSMTWDSTSASEGTHTLSAVARDGAGNTATATAVTVTVHNADTTPPTVSISAPTTGATVSGASVAVSATASDNVGVAGVQFKLDGANLGGEDTTTPYAITWNTSAVSNGSHTLTAVARDAAGNTATTTSVIVTVSNADVTPPTVTMTAPANGATVTGAIVTVSANASDNIGVAGVQFFLDGVATGAEVTTAPYAVVWNTTATPNGPHSVTAQARDAAGNFTTSSAVSVTVSNSGFPATLSIDVSASGDRSGSANTIGSSTFTTTGTNELLLAFVSADNNSGSTTVTGVTGGSLTWQLVVRTNTQRGTAEVWRAFAPTILTGATVTATLSQSVSASITVMTFKGADTSGTNGSGAIGATKSANAGSGAPTATLTTTRNGAWVFGVGNDWDNNAARTVGSNQTMVHQYLASVGDTYWVQRTTNATATAGSSVTINDTAPTGDRYNLSLVEILPGTVTADTTPPTITTVSPTNGAIGVSPAVILTAKFSEAMTASTVTSSTMQLRDASNALVPATVTYDAATATASIAPTAPLTAAMTYTATATVGLKDAVGNAMASAVSWSFSTSTTSTPDQGAGGPILVISSALNPFTRYYAEILRAEGMNAFAVNDISTVTTSVLAGYDLAILGEQTLTTAQVTMFTNWVQGGGKLIAMRPDKKLAALLSLSAQAPTLSNTYLAIDTTKAPGAGLVSLPMQFHGTADEYTLVNATSVATLYSDATHPTAFPAVTLTQIVNGGQAAAFTFDLAKSVVYTRQGNPAWAGQERDGFAPVRSDDMFFGAKSGDIQSDWVDLTKVQIPQADEQQRLLVNLILQMTSGGRPLPRFWYLPRGLKAAVVMTGDDHAVGGTPARFAQYLAASTAGCNVANWECIRSTAYVYPNAPMTDAQVAGYVTQGFEVGVHVTMDPQGTIACGNDYTTAGLQAMYTARLNQFTAAFPSAPAPRTHRMHCIMWSDWASQPLTEFQNGIRLDTSYYYWPASWILDHPGLFTGSGMPMRFANTDGSMIDVYQATTQMTDESGQTYPLHADTLLNNALGATGYYGVFTANMHTDEALSPGSDAIIASAKAHNVPVITAAQLLTWVDGRNNSTFGAIGWSGNVLTFSIAAAAGSSGLQVMVPTQAGALHLTTVTLNGSAVSPTTQTIKGVQYAFITVAAGQYRVTYVP